MANFAVSLTAPSGAIGLTATNGNLTIDDYSNYITSTEEGHLQANFSDFVKIYVTNPVGNIYSYSSLGGGDQSLSTPDSYLVSPYQTNYQYDKDGRYDVNLMAVPTWENVASEIWNDINIPNSSFSGFVLQSSGVTDDLQGVKFIDANNGWTCGENGVILNTTDGGATWIPQTSGTANDLRSICFIDANNGWASGVSGTILVTTNGGGTWTPQVSGTGEALEKIFFINANNGWACGTGGTIITTTNGGATWTPQVSGTGLGIWGIFFINANNGWACGQSGLMLGTTNGGGTWTPQTSGTTDNLEDIFFIDANNGWAAGGNGVFPGYAKIVATTNAGGTWTTQPVGAIDYLQFVSFIDSNNGWVCGDNGTILSTTNAGGTWMPQTSGVTDNLNNLSFFGTSNGWFVGDNGVILKYETITYSPKAINFPTELTGYICGTDSIILKSIDGGLTWNKLTVSVLTNLYDIKFATEDIGYCSGNLYGTGYILKTIDGGVTWTTELTTATSLYKLSVIDIDTVFCCCNGDATIYKTLNGGTGWSTYTLETMESIFFLNSLLGFIGSDTTKVWKTIDGGSNWTNVDLGSGLITNMYFIDSNTGFAIQNILGVSTTLWKTINSGSTWSSIITFNNPNVLTDVYFENINIGFLFVDNKIYKTTDGGLTWNLMTVSIGSYDPDDISFINGQGFSLATSTKILKLNINYNDYNEGDCVYYAGNLYQATADNYNETPSATSSFWSLIDEEDLPTKYSITETIMIVDDITECYSKKLMNTCCADLEVVCDDSELCDNKTFVELLTLDVMMSSIPLKVNQLEYDSADVILNEALDLCDCCKDNNR